MVAATILNIGKNVNNSGLDKDICTKIFEQNLVQSTNITLSTRQNNQIHIT